jgi:hypothetical protein
VLTDDGRTGEKGLFSLFDNLSIFWILVAGPTFFLNDNLKYLTVSVG